MSFKECSQCKYWYNPEANQFARCINGIEYYFCSNRCKEDFIKEKEKLS